MGQPSVKLSHELFTRYCANPLALDSEVRKAAGVPDNRYYTVALWPKELAGVVDINYNVTRIVHANKISKSNQQ